MTQNLNVDSEIEALAKTFQGVLQDQKGESKEDIVQKLLDLRSKYKSAGIEPSTKIECRSKLMRCGLDRLRHLFKELTTEFEEVSEEETLIKQEKKKIRRKEIASELKDKEPEPFHFEPPEQGSMPYIEPEALPSRKTIKAGEFLFKAQRRLYSLAEGTFSDHEKFPLQGLTSNLDSCSDDLLESYIELLSEYDDNVVSDTLQSPITMACLVNMEVIAATVGKNKLNVLSEGTSSNSS